MILFAAPLVAWILWQLSVCGVNANGNANGIAHKHAKGGKGAAAADRTGSRLTVSLFVRLILCGLVGLAPYWHLVYSGKTAKAGSWGDTSHWDGFTRHVLRSEYGSFRLSPFERVEGGEGPWTRTVAWGADAAQQFTTLGAGMAAVGAVASVALPFLPKATGAADGADVSASPGSSALSRRLGLAVAATLAVYLGVFNTLANLPVGEEGMAREVTRRFWMQPNIIVSLWLGLGLRTFSSGLGAVFGGGKRARKFGCEGADCATGMNESGGCATVVVGLGEMVVGWWH
jgi:hypothetical protein